MKRRKHDFILCYHGEYITQKMGEEREDSQESVFRYFFSYQGKDWWWVFQNTLCLNSEIHLCFRFRTFNKEFLGPHSQHKISLLLDEELGLRFWWITDETHTLYNESKGNNSKLCNFIIICINYVWLEKDVNFPLLSISHVKNIHPQQALLLTCVLCFLQLNANVTFFEN